MGRGCEICSVCAESTTCHATVNSSANLTLFYICRLSLALRVPCLVPRQPGKGVLNTGKDSPLKTKEFQSWAVPCLCSVAKQKAGVQVWRCFCHLLHGHRGSSHRAWPVQAERRGGMHTKDGASLLISWYVSRAPCCLSPSSKFCKSDHDCGMTQD